MTRYAFIEAAENYNINPACGNILWKPSSVLEADVVSIKHVVLCAGTYALPSELGKRFIVDLGRKRKETEYEKYERFMDGVVWNEYFSSMFVECLNDDEYTIFVASDPDIRYASFTTDHLSLMEQEANDAITSLFTYIFWDYPKMAFEGDPIDWDGFPNPPKYRSNNELSKVINGWPIKKNFSKGTIHEKYRA